ncbi:MAG: DALR anticodon-binding domain-containing protein, partial [Saprospiraceae bacterium]|nr:DALR anticodon-binding domain-containing protein [Saprospiraceae bacterium]
ISLAALKFFMIRVDARKRMTFDPAESVDMQGQTGPYIQNAFVRIRSIQRKAEATPSEAGRDPYQLVQAERDLVGLMGTYREVVMQAAAQYNPGLIANFCYQLAKEFHRYYHDYRILNAETLEARKVRMQLIARIADMLEAGMGLLGIQMPERM